MSNSAPKSFPREHLLNVPGTFDDKVRQMLAEKTSNESKAPRSEHKVIESATKKVPGVRKTITKPIATPNQYNREPVTHQPSQYRQGPVNEPARMPVFHKTGPVQNYYPQPNTNPGPQIYPNNHPQNQGPLPYQRHGPIPNGPNPQSMPYPQPYGDHYGMQHPPPYSNGNGNGPSSNKHQVSDFMVKTEEQPFPGVERGMIHGGRDAYINEMNPSNPDLGISRNGSANKGPVLSLKIAGSNTAETERLDRSPYNSFSKASYSREPIRSFGAGGGFSPERGGFFEKIEYNETRSDTSESMSHKSPTKIKKKVVKPLQKPAKHIQTYEDSFYTGKGASLSIMEKKEEEIINLAPKVGEELEEGELPKSKKANFSNANTTASMNSYLNTLYSKPNNFENDLLQDDTVLFLYDSKSFFVDAASFIFQ